MSVKDDNTVRMCLLDETKACDDCGECDRCDLDPNKICDNCCKCLALEDDEGEFRTVTIDGQSGSIVYNKATAKERAMPRGRHGGGKHKAAAAAASDGKTADGAAASINEEPTELTPELIAYWEEKLAEYGEGLIDDGLGEIRVSSRVPVSGMRKGTGPHRRGIRNND